MTATELHNLVKDWPREARPDTDESLTFVDGEWELDSHALSASAAVLMFEASGVRWLLDHENTDALTIIPAADKSAHFRIEMDLFRNPSSRNRNDKCSMTFDAPTLIEAIDAAIKGAQS